MKNQILLFLMLASAMNIRAQSGSLGRVTISSCGTNDSRLSVTMGEPLAGSYRSSDGQTILTVGAQTGQSQNVSDSLSLSTYSVSIDSKATNFDINLFSNRSWSIINPVSWLAVNNTAGSKDFKLNFAALENTSNNNRTAEVIVSAGTNIKTIVINQEGASSTVTKLKDEFEQVLIYPNPFSSELKISWNSDLFTLTNLKIFDVTGRALYEDILCKSNSNISLIELENGTYFIELTAADGSFTKTYKIIKINNN